MQRTAHVDGFVWLAPLVHFHLRSASLVFAPSSSSAQTMTLLKSVRMQLQPTAAYTNESPIYS
jgi:hypothetical protein